jgi:hypothetical protein
MQAPDIVEQFRVWGQEFDPGSPDLDLEVEAHPLSIRHIQELLAVTQMSQQYFAEVFCGGFFLRETVNHWLHKRKSYDLRTKYIILMACKYRFHLLESSPHRYSRRAG